MHAVADVRNQRCLRNIVSGQVLAFPDKSIDQRAEPRLDPLPFHRPDNAQPYSGADEASCGREKEHPTCDLAFEVERTHNDAEHRGIVEEQFRVIEKF